MAASEPTQDHIDATITAAFLFNLEADKGPRYIYGGMQLGAVINSFCRLTGIERMVWEAIIWPDQPITKPNKDAS